MWNGGPKFWILFSVPATFESDTPGRSGGIDQLREIWEEKHLLIIILLLLKVTFPFFRYRMLEEHSVNPVQPHDSIHKQTCLQKTAKILIKNLNWSDVSKTVK